MARVVITGMGCITAMGRDVAAFRESLFAGRSGIRTMTDAQGLHFSRTATVEGFDSEAWLLAEQRPVADRTAALAIAAARQAVSQSGVAAAHPGEEMAVVLGCSAGGRLTEEEAAIRLYTRNARVHPLAVPRTMANAGTSLVAMEHRITGPSLTLSTACASGTHAIGLAFQMIRAGSVRAALAGGHEAPLSLAFLRAWDSLKVVSPTACRPFARDRDGMTLGEGAAVLALEEREAARARGAAILGEIVGFGMSSDAHHITQPEAAGPAAAMERALADAGAGPEEVGYINAHGTGTESNDRVEAEAIHRVFGRVFGGRAVPVSSTKGLHGHAIGASGAIELLATVLALGEGVLPANACLGGDWEADAGLELEGLLGENRPTRTGLALSNSFAFGGMNAVLAVRRGGD
jgi:nodulation protein E